MSAFAVWVVPGEHSECFNEVAGGVAYALQQLGHESQLGWWSSARDAAQRGRLVVFGSHRVSPEVQLPADAIVYNAEQAREGSQHERWLQYVERLRRHQVWDYSRENIARLTKLGAERVAHCPVGHWPGLESIGPADESVDVLFYGSTNARRIATLARLRERGLSVKHLFGSYGFERDAEIARAKVVLNVHYFPRPIWEVFRCSYPVANKKLVVTEGGGCDAELEEVARRTCVVADYDALVDVCADYVSDEERRRQAAEQGYGEFVKMDQVAFVRQALGAL